MERLTKRQENLLGMLRWDGGEKDADVLGHLCAYARPRAACDRLVARGLAVKVRSGVYRAVVVRERKP